MPLSITPLSITALFIYGIGNCCNVVVVNQEKRKDRNMAVKDHSLDDKIVNAAWEEFMQHGFQKASLHKIVDKAGITTGALYTRYKNKDALFCSLIEDAMKELAGKSQPLREMYYAVEKSRSVEEFIQVMRHERDIYIDFLFQYYRECTLFFCHSEGSSIGEMLHRMMTVKSEETLAFMERIAGKPIDLKGIEMVLAEQFHFYRYILEKGYSKEEAISCMQTVNMFFEAGWKKLFEQILC